MADNNRPEVIAFDLDGTLAMRQEPFNPYSVGEPVETILNLALEAIQAGKRTLCFTARAHSKDPKVLGAVRKWLDDHGLEKMKITNIKDPTISKFYDDRAIGVVPDKGELLTKVAAEMVRKTRMVEVQDDHCPHCDHKFTEKGYPRPDFEQAEREGIEPMDADQLCPNCQGIVDSPEMTDDAIENYQGFGGESMKEILYRQREKKRSRIAVRTSKHKAVLTLGEPQVGGDEEKKANAHCTKNTCPKCGAVETCRCSEPITNFTKELCYYCQHPEERRKQASTSPENVSVPGRGRTLVTLSFDEEGAEKQAARDTSRDAFRTALNEAVAAGEVPHDIPFYVQGDKCLVNAGDWHEEEQIEAAMTLARRYFKEVIEENECGLPAGFIPMSANQKACDAGRKLEKEAAGNKLERLRIRRGQCPMCGGRAKEGGREHIECECDSCGFMFTPGWAEEKETADAHSKQASFDAAQVKSASVQVANRTGPHGILEALKALNLDDLEKQARADIASGKITKRDRGVKMLNALEGLRRNETRPEELMIKRVPVLPPAFRPFSFLGATYIPGDANELYQDLFKHRAVHEETLKTLGEGGAALTRTNLLNATRALYGYGEPVSPKLKERGPKGYLDQLLNDGPKHSYVQRRMLSKPIDNVGRSVITVDPDLGLDEVSIPREMAWTLAGSKVHRRLSLMGMSPAEAIKAVKDRDAYATRALELEIKENPVLVSRAPAWHKFNAVGQFVKLHDGPHIAINPYITAGQGADFNGDCQVGKVFVLLAKEFICQNQESFLQSCIDDYMVGTMIAKNIIPAFNRLTQHLALVDLQDFPRTELQGENPNGKNGPIQFYSVPEGTQVVAFDEATGQVEWQPVVSYSIHPQRSIEIVDLSNGRQITTDDDPRAVYGLNPATNRMERHTPDEAFELGLLVPCVKDVAGACANLGKLMAVELGEINGSMRTQELTWDFGYLLGALVGDGWWDKKRYDKGKSIYLSDLQEFNAFRVFTILRGMFGQVGWYRQEFKKTELAGRYGYTIRHTYQLHKADAFVDFLDKWLGGAKTENSTGSASKCLPDFFLLAPREFREGLLNGMVDTDGTICVSNAKGKPQLLCSVTSTSLRLISDIKFLCLTLGIQTTVGFSKTTTRGNTSWVCSISAVDIKRTPLFNNLASPWKRDAYLNTSVQMDNTSQVFDKIPLPSDIAAVVQADLICPKIKTHERKLDTPDVLHRKHQQNMSELWRSASEIGLVGRDTAARVLEHLAFEQVQQERVRLQAIEDLQNGLDVCDKTRTDLWRAAIRACAPNQAPVELYREGCAVAARLNQPLKRGKIGTKCAQGVLSFLLRRTAYLGALADERVQHWFKTYNENRTVSWARVTAVQKTGIKEDGYDLTVPGFETFMAADGIILSNTINISMPVLPESVQEVKDKLMASKMLFSIKDPDAVVPLPKHEQILGIWTAAKRPSTKVHAFASGQEALASIRRGDVKLEDEIEIPDA